MQQAKINYYGNLDVKDISVNRKFWKTVKPLFSNKIQTPSNITLLEGDELVSDDKKIAKIINDYFVNIIDRLETAGKEKNLTKTNKSCDLVDDVIDMYKSHPSIKLIKQKSEARDKFSFQQVSLEEIENKLRDLNPTKSSTLGSIPMKLLTEHSDLFAPMLHFFINESVNSRNFPNELKKGDITSPFENGDAFAEKNYRPMTVLPAMTKISERIISSQIMCYIDDILSPYLCVSRKDYNTQHALLRLVEKKCRSSVDKKGIAGTILMDLSKAFDWLNHELLIAKLEA